jgi:hypothetical protein
VLGSVEDRVEAFEECVTVYEVETLSGGCANIMDDEVDVVRRAPDELVECARPNLRVWGELERRAPDREEERLEIGILRRGDAEETVGVV